MSRGRSILMIVIGAIFVALGVLIWVVDPGAWIPAMVAILFFGAVVAVGALERWGHRVSEVAKARMMGAVALVMGLGCGAMAVATWSNPGFFTRGPQPFIVGVGLVGLVFFGGGGLLLMIRGGRPFGVDRDGFRR